MRYTLVQHSGAGYGGKAGFAQAVEEASVTTKGEQARVERAGGLLFDSYAEAHKRAMEENYPPEVEGLYPRAKGTFANSMVDGLKIYIPAKEDKGNG